MKNSFIFTLPKTFKKSFGQYRWQILFLTTLSLINGIFEGIGISTVVPIFSFIAKDGNKGNDLISRSLERFFDVLNISFSLRSLLIFIVFIFVAKIIALFSSAYITARVMADFETNTKMSLFVHTLRANWGYLSKQKIGHLDQILSTNVTLSSSLFGVFSTLILISAKALVYIFVAINISRDIAFITLFLAFISFLLFKPLFLRNKRISSKSEFLNRDISHYVNENILGMKTVKYFHVEELVIAKANKLFTKIRGLMLNVAVIKSLLDSTIQVAGIVFVISIFTFFYKTSVFNFASFAVIIYAINQIFIQIQAAQGQLHRLSSQTPYLLSLLDYQEKAIAQKEMIGEKKNRFNFNDKIEFNNVSFTFSKDVSVLENISFVIRKNEMIGLIGPSGSGKTTIVDMLLRLHEPQQGKITIDSNDIRDIDMSEWRNNIGYVSQDIFLMNDTIIKNIAFYNTDLEFDQIKRAAQMANIHTFIEQLPQGYETIVGERGIFLSNGQRQRIILARVLARNPKILILDEATSALDSESEILIQKTINDLRGQVTMISIAHRLSTVSALDRLLVVGDGRILEEGRPKDLLLNKDSYFYKVSSL